MKRMKLNLVAERLRQQLGEPVVSLSEAMQRLKIISRTTILSWEKQGLLSRVTDPQHPTMVFFRASEIARLVDEPTTEAVTEPAPVEDVQALVIRLINKLPLNAELVLRYEDERGWHEANLAGLSNEMAWAAFVTLIHPERVQRGGR